MLQSYTSLLEVMGDDSGAMVESDFGRFVFFVHFNRLKQIHTEIAGSGTHVTNSEKSGRHSPHRAVVIGSFPIASPSPPVALFCCGQMSDQLPQLGLCAVNAPEALNSFLHFFA